MHDYTHNTFIIIVLLWLTEIIECCGRFKSSWVWCKSRRLFQLTETTLTTLWHNFSTLAFLLSLLIAFVTARWRLCPKHDTLIHFKMLAATLILELLSVVMQACCFGHRFHSCIVASSMSAIFSLVWSCGRKLVHKETDWSFIPSVINCIA